MTWVVNVPNPDVLLPLSGNRARAEFCTDGSSGAGSLASLCLHGELKWQELGPRTVD